MNYYRTRSIPELCRITLTPSGENSFQQDETKEMYFTQYTHSFGHEIEKPHIVAWKRAFEDGDVAHKDSKLCMVNSPVGSKPGDYPGRRKSAPPGSFVFNYDALDIPEPLHRRSKSLGLAMDSPLDFDLMDSQVGAVRSNGDHVDPSNQKLVECFHKGSVIVVELSKNEILGQGSKSMLQIDGRINTKVLELTSSFIIAVSRKLCVS